MNFKMVNYHFKPWGGNPLRGADAEPATAWATVLKDPQVWNPDFWNFPSGETFGPGMIGRVHRGTPWQTVYLKSSPIDLATWQKWTGDSDAGDAIHSMPTNDWHLSDTLFSLWNTNPPAQLLSPNVASVESWSATLDGFNALTNSAMDGSAYSPYPTFDNLILSSNAPPATTLANALCLARAAQPGGYFNTLGDILSVPELTTNTPCLFLNSEDARRFNVTDLAYEIVPSQLLAKLKPDSVGSVIQTSVGLQAKFTGIEGIAYLVQSSTNFTDWQTVSTNYPFAGSFHCDLPPVGGEHRFYRSVMLP